MIGGERINCKRIIAYKFNEYFVSLASNLNASIDPQGGVLINNVPPFCQYLTNKVESSIYLYDTYDLEKTLKMENQVISQQFWLKNQLNLFRHY